MNALYGKHPKNGAPHVCDSHMQPEAQGAPTGRSAMQFPAAQNALVLHSVPPHIPLQPTKQLPFPAQV